MDVGLWKRLAYLAIIHFPCSYEL